MTTGRDALAGEVARLLTAAQEGAPGLSLEAHLATRDAKPTDVAADTSQVLCVDFDEASFGRLLQAYHRSASGARCAISERSFVEYCFADVVYQNMNNEDMRVLVRTCVASCVLPKVASTGPVILGLVATDKLPFSAFPSNSNHTDRKLVHRVTFKPRHDAGGVGKRWSLAVNFEESRRGADSSNDVTRRVYLTLCKVPAAHGSRQQPAKHAAAMPIDPPVSADDAAVQAVLRAMADLGVLPDGHLR